MLKSIIKNILNHHVDELLLECEKEKDMHAYQFLITDLHSIVIIVAKNAQASCPYYFDAILYTIAPVHTNAKVVPTINTTVEKKPVQVVHGPSFLIFM